MHLERLHPPLLALVALSSLAVAQGPDTTPPAFTAAPVVAQNPNPAAPLTARLTVTADEPVMIDLQIREATRAWRTSPSPSFSQSHVLPIVGFRPGRPHRIIVSIRDAAGNRATWPIGLTFTTPALPANFPPLTVAISQPALMEAGVTLTGLRWSSSTLPGSGTYCVYLDSSGQVVWLYESTTSPRDIIRLRNGNFLQSASSQLAREIDPYGNVVTEWWAARQSTAGAPPGAVLVDCDSFHHEMHELPEAETADFIALSTDLRAYPNYPTSEIDPTQTTPSANVLGDVVVEFRRDGTLVRELNVFDVIDPYRLCYGSLAPAYNSVYGVAGRDWSHGNAASVVTHDDTWIISLRHQDAVLKVRRSNGALVWIHGSHERWVAPWSQHLLAPIGDPFEWNFHQHTPHLDASGSLTLFDNGNYRVIPPAMPLPTNQWYSRAVRFEVDPSSLTSRQAWEYRGATPFFSGTLGDADPLTVTGNVLIADGAKPVPGLNRQYSRVLEVTGGSPTTVVFEVIVNDPAMPPTNPYNWNIYRAERYSNVYAHLD